MASTSLGHEIYVRTDSVLIETKSQGDIQNTKLVINSLPYSTEVSQSNDPVLKFDARNRVYIGPPTETGQSQLSGTGFVKASGTTISYDNSDYATDAELSSGLSGKAATSHTHAAADVTSGTFDAARIPDLSATYATAAGLASYLTTSTAAATYATITNLNTTNSNVATNTTNIATNTAAIDTKLNKADSTALNGYATQYDITQISAGSFTETNTLTETTPSTPPSGTTLFTRKRAGRYGAASKGADGSILDYQPSLYSRKVTVYGAQPNTAGLSWLGATPATTGTQAAATINTTNYFGAQVRNTYSTAASANTTVSVRGPANYLSGQFGYFSSFRFGVNQAGSGTSRGFIGLGNSTNTLTATSNPSTFASVVAAAWDAGSTTLSIMHNDATGTATVVSLGANFPVNTSGVDFYEIRFYQAPGASQISYSVERLNTGDIADGTITTDLPSLSTLLNTHTWMTNGSTAEVIGIAFSQTYTENF